MGVTLTDVLLFGKAQSDDVDNATFVIYRRNILRWSALGGYLDIIVKGVSPISLPDAIADSLEYLKAFGGTEFVPETHLDTVTAEGKCEQRNLPDSYIQRQFIYMMDGSYLLTDIVPTYDGRYELEIQTTNIANSPATYLGCLQSGSTDQGLRFAHITNGAVRVIGFGSVADSSSGATTANTRYKFVWNNNIATVTTGGTTVLSHTFSDNQSTTTPLAINALNNGGVISGNIEGIYLYSFKAWDNQGNLIADYVPAVQKGTVPVVGFYDTVTDTFKGPTAGTFAAGGEAVPTPDTPMDIWCNNGVLRVSKNLCNNVFEQGSINANGSDYGGSELTSRIRLKDFITLPAGTYTISCDSAYEVYLYRTGGTAAWLQTDTFTFSSSGQVRFAVRNKANPTADVLPTAPVNVMLNAGSSALPYTPYSATGIYTDGTTETITDDLGNTATCQNLLSVGTYEDTQEVLSGAITRSVGVKVLDGTEGWESLSGYMSILKTNLGTNSTVLPANSTNIFCTHFQVKTDTFVDGVGSGNSYVNFKYDSVFTTLAQWKQFLSDQYAAGTPVIIVYPLATATTESVAGQTLLKAPLTTVGSLENLVVTPTSSSHTVPTPTQPLDINSNNGVLKVRHQSGLPWGYTAVEYLQNGSDNCAINTGIVPTNTTRVEMKWSVSDTGSIYIFGSRPGGITQVFTLSGSQSGGTVTAYANGYYKAANTDGVNWSRTSGIDNIFNSYFALNNGEVEYAVDDLVNDRHCDEFFTYTPWVSDINTPLHLFSNGYNSQPGGAKIWYCKIYNGETLLMDLVPVIRSSDNVGGFYDKVGGGFYTTEQGGTYTGTPITDPVEIYADGTVETINVHGKNLYTTDGAVINYALDADGIPSLSSRFFYTKILPVTAGSVYTFSGVSGSDSTGLIRRVHCYVDGVWYSQLATFNIGTVGRSYSATFTIPTGCNGLRVSMLKVDTNVQLERGSTATAYTPYFDGGTATAEMLLKVGDYEDVQSIIDGVVTRNVGVKVFDGTEIWNYSGGVDNAFYISGSGQISGAALYCTHFQGVSRLSADLQIRTGGGWQFLIRYNAMNSDVANFKQFLADQYAAGTPVIVVYPLATPTTESVAGQALQVQQGDNIVEITQAAIDGLEIEAKYQAAVTLTIQEVQDANLDPNVEVTIN